MALYLSNMQIEAFLKRVELLIATKKMKKKDFYEKSGVSSSLYSQWNTGKVKPGFDKIGGVAEALEVPVEYLIFGDSEQNNIEEVKNTAEQIVEQPKASTSYNDDEEVIAIRQMLLERPEMRTLYKTARHVPASAIYQSIAIMEKYKEESEGK